MTYLDAIAEARAINDLRAASSEYVRRWNALEDRLKGLSPADAEAILNAAEVESAHDMCAQIVITMLES